MAETLDPKLDVVFKALLTGPAHQELLSSLLTALLQPASPIAQVSLLDPSIRGEMVDDKNIMLDVLVRLQDGRYVNVQRHMSIRPGHRERSLMYLSRTYAGQLARGQPYGALCPAVGVHLVSKPLLLGSRFHSIFRLLEVRDHELYSDAMELHVVELSKLSKRSSSSDDLVRWGRFLMASTDEQRCEAVDGDRVMEKAKAELERLSTDPVVQDLAQRRRLAQQMNEIEQALVWKEAHKQGRDEGRKQGHDEGCKQSCRANLRAILQARSFKASDEINERITACGDLETLGAWVVKAVTAESLDDVFAE